MKQARRTVNLSHYYVSTLGKTICCRKPMVLLHPKDEYAVNKNGNTLPLFALCVKCGRIGSSKEGGRSINE